MEIKARAKINLSLDVIGRREDGYHLLRMVMQNVDVYDTLTMERVEEEGIQLTADVEGIPLDSGNLIWKAADLLMKEFQLPGGVRIHLQKRIPAAAGLAGGSADAAAVFHGMNALFELGLSEKELRERGVTLGADIPYCIMGGTALSEGIGEVLTPLPKMPDCWILLAKPDIDVSTKYVYEHLDAAVEYHHPEVDRQVQAIRNGDLKEITACLENVLETVTVSNHPIVTRIEERMLELGALGSRMSGSGPTVFGIFDNEETAQKAYKEILDSHLAKDVFLTVPYSDKEEA
ncbi:MAG: 4-(cytidine 5'-diphospho)-2-C-methyl-D-erythritol kinase [Eubacteriales bacterium]|nr:4-(cytidine 5'-diphospho)-2-C-methyl-D-erythritol kinase [Eubacteriales bacterium]